MLNNNKRRLEDVERRATEDNTAGEQLRAYHDAHNEIYATSRDPVLEELEELSRRSAQLQGDPCGQDNSDAVASALGLGDADTDDADTTEAAELKERFYVLLVDMMMRHGKEEVAAWIRDEVLGGEVLIGIDELPPHPDFAPTRCILVTERGSNERDPAGV